MTLKPRPLRAFVLTVDTADFRGRDLNPLSKRRVRNLRGVPGYHLPY